MSPEEVRMVLEQMKSGKTYYDDLDEFEHGESRTYYYDHSAKSFAVEVYDVVVGSYRKVTLLSERTMYDFLIEKNIHEFILLGYSFRY